MLFKTTLQDDESLAYSKDAFSLFPTSHSEFDLPEEYAHNTLIIVSNIADYKNLTDNFLKQNNVWILTLEDMSEEKIDELPLNLESNFLTIENSLEGEIQLNEWYKVSAGPLMKGLYGTWTKEESGKWQLHVDQPNKWERRKNFGGAVLKNGFIPQSALHTQNVVVRLERSNSSGKFEQVGILADVVGVLKSRLNFTEEIVLVADDKFGSQNPDGTWNGIVGDLALEKLDFSSAGLTITAGRSEAIDFTFGVIQDSTTLLLGREALHHRSELNVWAYMTVFPRTVWLFILMSMFLTACFFEMHRKLFVFKQSSQFDGFATGFSVFFLALLQLSVPTHRQRIQYSYLSSRVLFMSMSFLTMVLFVHYTGDLTAFMTVGDVKVSVNSFQVGY